MVSTHFDGLVRKVFKKLVIELQRSLWCDTIKQKLKDFFILKIYIITTYTMIFNYLKNTQVNKFNATAIRIIYSVVIREGTRFLFFDFR